MENKELTIEEMDYIMAGNSSLNQLISIATQLYDEGYTKEEAVIALSKKFDLNNQIIVDTLNSIYKNQDIETILKKI